MIYISLKIRFFIFQLKKWNTNKKKIQNKRRTRKKIIFLYDSFTFKDSYSFISKGLDSLARLQDEKI